MPGHQRRGTMTFEPYGIDSPSAQFHCGPAAGHAFLSGRIYPSHSSSQGVFWYRLHMGRSGLLAMARRKVPHPASFPTAENDNDADEQTRRLWSRLDCAFPDSERGAFASVIDFAS